MSLSIILHLLLTQVFVYQVYRRNAKTDYMATNIVFEGIIKMIISDRSEWIGAAKLFIAVVQDVTFHISYTE